MSSEHDEILQASLKRGYSPARRRFLLLMMAGLSGFGASLIAIPFVGGIIAPLLAAPKGVWRAVGKVDSFKVGETVEVTYEDPAPLPWAGVTAKNAVFLRRDTANSFVALTIYCQHLGCGVRWDPSARLFFCPCHGGVYYATGERASGPPPRGLYPCVYRVTRVRGLDVLEIQAPHFPTLQDTLRPG